MSSRILVVDDEPTIRCILSQVLEEAGHEVTEAASGEEALETFQTEPFPVVITDIIMKRMSGIDLLQNLKEIEPEVEVVIMTSQGTLDTATSALRAGAFDYLLKPFQDLDAISTLITRALGKKLEAETTRRAMSELQNSTKELKQTNEKLKTMAMRDGLTGLYNHRSFRAALMAEVNRSHRNGGALSLVFMDVDHFKQYNDTHGHMAGDELLKTLGALLEQDRPKASTVARYGGEEFVMVLPDIDRERATEIAEEVRQRVASHPFENGETQPAGRVTLSLGVASYPEDGETEDTLIAYADSALYRAKESGRNTVC